MCIQHTFDMNIEKIYIATILQIPGSCNLKRWITTTQQSHSISFMIIAQYYRIAPEIATLLNHWTHLDCTPLVVISHTIFIYLKACLSTLRISQWSKLIILRITRSKLSHGGTSYFRNVDPTTLIVRCNILKSRLNSSFLQFI